MSSHRTKFTPRARPAVFMSYPPGMKGYKLFYIERKIFFVSWDVVFHEGIFPFLNIPADGNSVDPFPDLVLPCAMDFQVDPLPNVSTDSANSHTVLIGGSSDDPIGPNIGDSSDDPIVPNVLDNTQQPSTLDHGSNIDPQSSTLGPSEQ